MSVAVAMAGLLMSADPGACIPVPVTAGHREQRFHDDTPLRTTVFLNFGGGPLAHPFGILSADDNSAENRSVLLSGPVEFPAYDGNQQTAVATAQAVAADLAPFGVRVVYEQRPPKRLPYAMAMMGGDPTDVDTDANFVGVAPIDCELETFRHIVYVFDGDAPPLSQSNTALQEIAHAWGLDHTLGDTDVMSYSGYGSDKGFVAGCREYCEAECLDGPIFCRERHEEFCPPGQQDAVAELRHIFGSGAPDTQAPTAAFLEPAPGESFEVGDDVLIRAEISDDFRGYGWQLTVARDGEVILDEPDYSGDPRWLLQQPRAGRYALTLTVEDHADHITTAEVEIRVGDDPDGGSGSDTGADESSGTTATMPPTEGSDSSTVADSGTGAPQDEPALDADGCGCRPRRSGPGGVALVFLVLAATRRSR